MRETPGRSESSVDLVFKIEKKKRGAREGEGEKKKIWIIVAPIYT